MKKVLFLCLCILGLSSAKGQILTPVKWSYAAKKINGKEAVVFIKATIDQGWHLYSQHIQDGGPVKTSFTFEKSSGYQLNGQTAEPKPITKYEETFGMNVSYFENAVVFQQKIKLSGSLNTVKGKLEYMVCNDQQCLPPEEINFTVPVK